MFSRFSELSHFIHKTKFTIPSYSIRFFNKGGSKKTKLELEIKKLKSSQNKLKKKSKNHNSSPNKDEPDLSKDNVLYVIAGGIILYSAACILYNVKKMKGIPTISPDKFQNEYLIHGEVKQVNLFGPISKLLSGVVAEIILHPDEDRKEQKLALIGCKTNQVGYFISEKERELQIAKHDGLIPTVDLTEFYLFIAFILIQIKSASKGLKKYMENPEGIFAAPKPPKSSKPEIPKYASKGMFDKKVDPKKPPPFSNPFDIFADKFSETIATEFNHKSDVKFKDVAGLHTAKQEVKEFLDYLNNPARFIELGARLPRGAMLLGPPGCGKTLLVRALSNESNVPFFYSAGSDIGHLLVGVGAKRLRKLFASARRASPAIIFLDEIDSIGKKRGGGGRFGGENDSDQILNQLLAEMDGMDSNVGVVVFAATNRADVLDAALTRPGRFDRHILIDLPVLEERKEIFELYLKKNEKNLDTDLVQLRDKLSLQTPGMSGADIANLCNEAALAAAKYDYTTIKAECFDIALERIVTGAFKKNRILNESERKIVAYHEAGHVLVGWLLKYAEPVLKVSIVPRTDSSLGFSQLTPSEKYLQTTEMLNDKIAVLMGGRAAESLIFNSITSGALDDLKKVKKIAFSMVRELGMSKRLGHLSFSITANDEFYESYPYSRNTRDIIDAEANSIVVSAYKRADAILRSNKEKLELIAKELLLREVLKYSDIQNLIGARPHEIVN